MGKKKQAGTSIYLAGLQFRIDRDHLARALGKIILVAEKKGDGVGTQVLFVAREGEEERIQVAATDLISTLLLTCTADVDQSGSLLLPAKQLREIVRRLPPGDVHIAASGPEGHHALLTIQQVGYKIFGKAPDEFPAVIRPELPAGVEVGRHDLARATDRTEFSVATDQDRPNLCGIWFRQLDGRLQLVSTDGHRLSRVLTDRVENGGLGAAGLLGSIVPPKALRALGDIFTDSTVWIGIDDSRAILIDNSATLIVQVIEGVFPNFEHTFGPPMYVVSIDRQPLMVAIERIALMANNKTPQVNLELTESRLRISALSMDKGEAWEDLAIYYDGPELLVGANSQFLLDALKACQDERFELGVTDELSGIHIRNPREPDCLWLVMPISPQSAEEAAETGRTHKQANVAASEAPAVDEGAL